MIIIKLRVYIMNEPLKKIMDMLINRLRKKIEVPLKVENKEQKILTPQRFSTLTVASYIII